MKLRKLNSRRMALWFAGIFLCSAGIAALTGWANSPLWFMLYPLLIIPLLLLIVLAAIYLFQRI